MDRGLCHFCHVKPILGRKRKYCEEHSRLASVLLKRDSRRLSKEQGKVLEETVVFPSADL